MGLDWSPDGRWLLARGWGYIEVVERATGAAFEIPFTATWGAPAWSK